MALWLFDFKCLDCGTVHEALVDKNMRDGECAACGGTTTRLISPVRSKLDGLDPGFPDAYEKWAKKHEKAGRQPEPQIVR